MSRQKEQKISGQRTLADFLTKIKKLSGKTDKQIGAEIGTSSANVRRWRLGLVVPPLPTVKYIASVYGTTSEELGGGAVNTGSPAELTGNNRKSMELLEGILRAGHDDLSSHIARQLVILNDLCQRRKK